MVSYEKKNKNIDIVDLERCKHYVLEFDTEYQGKNRDCGYYSKSYWLKCDDYRDVPLKANYVRISLYYCHKEYEFDICLYNRKNGVSQFANGEMFKYKGTTCTDNLSKKQIEELIKVIRFNFKNFMTCFEKMNKGIEVL